MDRSFETRWFPCDICGDEEYEIVCKLGYGAFSTVWLKVFSMYALTAGLSLDNNAYSFFMVNCVSSSST
jgi:hypothetical protein